MVTNEEKWLIINVHCYQVLTGNQGLRRDVIPFVFPSPFV